MSAPNAIAIFKSLDHDGLRKVARSGRTDIEDVQQHALMICAEIAAGQCTFNPALGSVEQYVYGKLWGWAAREALFRSENLAEEDAPESYQHAATADEDADPLRILMNREIEREAEQKRCEVVATVRRFDPFVALELCLAAGAAGNQTAEAMGRHRATAWRKRREALAAVATLLGIPAPEAAPRRAL